MDKNTFYYALLTLCNVLLLNWYLCVFCDLSTKNIITFKNANNDNIFFYLHA